MPAFRTCRAVDYDCAFNAPITILYNGSACGACAGEGTSINTGTFSNDMTTFATKDDVLTLLVHLGYLTYNSTSGNVTIPNKEVSQEYYKVIFSGCTGQKVSMQPAAFPNKCQWHMLFFNNMFFCVEFI